MITEGILKTITGKSTDFSKLFYKTDDTRKKSKFNHLSVDVTDNTAIPD